MATSSDLGQIRRSGGFLGNFGDKLTKCLTGIRPRTGRTASPIIREGGSIYHLSHTPYALPLVEIAHSSNVIINGGIFSSGQGDVHIHNGVSEFEFGMHSFGSV